MYLLPAKPLSTVGVVKQYLLVERVPIVHLLPHGVGSSIVVDLDKLGEVVRNHLTIV